MSVVIVVVVGEVVVVAVVVVVVIVVVVVDVSNCGAIKAGVHKLHVTGHRLLISNLLFWISKLQYRVS